MSSMDWAISGVNTSSTSGGPACRNYMPDSWRILESIYIVGAAFAMTWWGYQRLTLPQTINKLYRHDCCKILLLVIFSITLGIEIGFKLASKTVIYLLNPCHVMTVMQLYLLAAPPSNTITTIFRIHLNLLNGPILAFLFPETDNRRLPFEKWVYWVQHSLLVIVPFYLLRQGGYHFTNSIRLHVRILGFTFAFGLWFFIVWLAVIFIYFFDVLTCSSYRIVYFIQGAYNVEPLRDMAWVSFSYGLNLLYHFMLLQPLAFPISVNLNHMLCPAETDPFSGPYYRTFAAIHQGLLCPLACKLVCLWLASAINDDKTPLRLVRCNQSKDK